MAKPVLFAVDDEAEVLRAIERDLRRKYGEKYRILRAISGVGAHRGTAMTEALSCRDEDVYIVGGANSAGQAAMFFARYARKVVMLVRGDSLSKGMSQYLVDQI